MHCLKYLLSLHFFNFNSLLSLHHFSLTNMKFKVVFKHKILTEIIHAEKKWKKNIIKAKTKQDKYTQKLTKQQKP